MTYTTAIILNAVFASLVLAGLTRIIWFGLCPPHEETSFSMSNNQQERPTERLAA